MIDIEGIIKNESVEDVLLYFSLRMLYQDIDRRYTNYKFEVIASGELLSTMQRLLEEEKLVFDRSIPKTLKDPNWKEPDFVKQKKYGIK